MKKIISILIVSMLAIASGLSAFAGDINVRGKVTQQGTGEPIQGVVITNVPNKKLLGTTNAFGEYHITVNEDATLEFRILGFKDLEVPVQSNLELNVAMMREAQMLNDVTVIGKATSNGLILPPADLILEGNEISLKTYVKIPHQLFNSNERLIVQPAIYNVSTRTLYYLTPEVRDGHRYNITQRRMLDWDLNNDPLHEYVDVKTTGRRTDDTVYVADKLYVEDPTDDFMCIIMSSLENYNGIIYSDTTQIAHGTKNPLRFLTYQLNGIDITDKNFLPMPEVSLHDTKGEINLVFNVGKSNLDMSVGDNAAELEKVAAKFRSIHNNKDATLKSFSISGIASPEGSYETNLKLAQKRMQSALTAIRQAIPEGLANNADITSEASVATWSDVVDLLRQDGHDSEANDIENIIKKYPRDVDVQTRMIRRLPFYRPMLVETYLPRLRKVEYSIVTSSYRPLNLDEINALYAEDYTQLSPYHFWKLYTETTDSVKREIVMRRAVDTHPDFITAANDLTAFEINTGESTDAFLKHFFEDWKKIKKLPLEARYNLGVASLDAKHYSYADSLLYELPDEPRFAKAKMYSAALNGRYSSVLQEIAEESPFNEVLLLLALKDDSRAWDKAQQLGNSAEEEYVKAIAANRMANNDAASAYLFVEAETHLANAIHLKPELLDVARIDGDVCEMLDEDGNLNVEEYITDEQEEL